MFSLNEFSNAIFYAYSYAIAIMRSMARVSYRNNLITSVTINSRAPLAQDYENGI